MHPDPRFQFEIRVSSKVIIRKQQNILLTREPRENRWMPGRLSLPGGKCYLHEDIIEGTVRKILEETGVRCKLVGVLKVLNLVMADRTTYHIIFVADYISSDIQNSELFTSELKWNTSSNTLSLTEDYLTEYYYIDLFKEYFSAPKRYFPLEFIQVLKPFSDPKIKEWMARCNVD